ncbi:MAG: hypothetical protein WCV55_00955 [Candidatus Paceibacterota bacterium]
MKRKIIVGVLFVLAILSASLWLGIASDGVFQKPLFGAKLILLLILLMVSGSCLILCSEIGGSGKPICAIFVLCKYDIFYLDAIVNANCSNDQADLQVKIGCDHVFVRFSYSDYSIHMKEGFWYRYLGSGKFEPLEIGKKAR